VRVTTFNLSLPTHQDLKVDNYEFYEVVHGTTMEILIVASVLLIVFGSVLIMHQIQTVFAVPEAKLRYQGQQRLDINL